MTGPTQSSTSFSGTRLSEADRESLRLGAREAFASVSPSSAVRASMATTRGWEGTSWQRLCGELDLAGMAVPEHFGGAGWTTAELGVVFEEAGRVLLCAPLFAVSALAIPQLLASGDEAICAAWLPKLIDGSANATAVTQDAAGRHPATRSVTATPAAGGWTITGRAGYVIDGGSADLVLVPAQTPDGTGLFLVTAGYAVTQLATLDQTRKQAHLTFDATPAQLVGGADAAAAIDSGFDTARALLACEQVGGAACALDMTVDYAKSRVQFGRQIGSFQAVKQKCADLLVSLESARSAATAAAGNPDSLTASVAHAFCSRAFTTITAATIQLHGGIGFTWEHDAHLYYKRARTSEAMLGSYDEQIESIAHHLAESI